ncbi:MAG: hypothetical protein HPY73_02500 [Methanomassiliicoccales archaeon]|nr:MAG: hypothetical protein HPY73_02500 [Methanomassiliicoccales archaeon]
MGWSTVNSSARADLSSRCGLVMSGRMASSVYYTQKVDMATLLAIIDHEMTRSLVRHIGLIIAPDIGTWTPNGTDRSMSERTFLHEGTRDLPLTGGSLGPHQVQSICMRWSKKNDATWSQTFSLWHLCVYVACTLIGYIVGTGLGL